MDREPRNSHFHIHWIKKKILDWEPFKTHAEARLRAQELAGPNEIFTVEELSTTCPVCGGKAATASWVKFPEFKNLALFVAGYGLIARAQKSCPISMMRAPANPAAPRLAVILSRGCPEWRVKPNAIMPPGFGTRHISCSPATGSGQTCMELIASASSKDSLRKGKVSTESLVNSTLPALIAFAFRTLAARTISAE